MSLGGWCRQMLLNSMHICPLENPLTFRALSISKSQQVPKTKHDCGRKQKSSSSTQTTQTPTKNIGNKWLQIKQQIKLETNNCVSWTAHMRSGPNHCALPAFHGEIRAAQTAPNHPTKRQPTDPPSNAPMHQPTNAPTNKTTNQQTHPSTHRPTNEPNNQRITNTSTNPPTPPIYLSIGSG